MLDEEEVYQALLLTIVMVSFSGFGNKFEI